MLVSVAIMYFMCMPMGYVVGKNFVRRKTLKWENTIDQETVRNDYAFLPLVTAFLLPMAAMLAILEIVDGE